MIVDDEDKTTRTICPGGSEKFGAIRTIVRNNNNNDEIWFVGKDVAEALGYARPNKAINDHVDDDNKTVNDSFTVNSTLPLLINESGLYSLILSSKLESAREFKQQKPLVNVTSEFDNGFCQRNPK